jgi:hypothetical protein
MDDTKPAQEGNEPGLNKIDLSALQDFSFGTQWTEVKPVSPQRRDRDFDRGPRDRRGDSPGPGGDAKRDRRGFKRPAGTPAGPGDSTGAGQRREREDRPRGEGFRGGQRRDFRGGERGEFPTQDRAPYVSPYFNITIYPEDAGFAAMVKAVRASCRTFQLFEITKAVLEKNERFVIVVQRKPAQGERPAAPAPSEGAESPAAESPKREKLPPLYYSVPDHLPFDTEEAAIAHVLKNHLSVFFDTQEVEVDPPKGNFPIINKCGITGELLGPPNYHLYQQIIQQHHATRLGRMSFERFRDSITSVREPEVVQQWLDKMKKATRYLWKGVPAKATKSTPPMPATEKPAEATSAAPAPADPVTPAAESTPAPEQPAQAAPTAEAPAPAAEAAPDKPVVTFDSLDEARAHLLAEGKHAVVRAVEHVRFHGKNVGLIPPGEIRRAVEGHIERQRKFPLDTANALRGRLRREGFTIFKKGARGVSYVCAVKRRFRVPGQVFSDSITALIDFIEKHPMIHVRDLPKALLGIDVAAALAAAPLPESMPASQAPYAVLPPEQADRLRKMGNDLRWLVSEGYVTEFSDGKLFAAPPMAPQVAKKTESGEEEHDPVDFPEAPAAAVETTEDRPPAAMAADPAPPEAPPADPAPAADPAATEPSKPEGQV